jgi:hypothetical protein
MCEKNSVRRSLADFRYLPDGANFSIRTLSGDGSTFEFFIFDSSQKPSFSVGVTQPPTGQRVASQHVARLRRFPVANIEGSGAPAFIVSLRPICEIIFYFFLRGWKQGLQAVQHQQQLKGQSTHQDSEELSWASAIRFADSAIQTAVNAAIKGSQKDFETAESDAEKALTNLAQRFDFIAKMLSHSS